MRPEHFYEPGGTINKGSATGFVASFATDRFALVTNRHVVDLPWSNSKYDGTQLTRLTAEIWTANNAVMKRVSVTLNSAFVRYHPDPSVDIAAIEMSRSTMQAINDGSSTAMPEDYSIELAGCVPIEYFATEEDFTSSIDAGELVFFPGYPEWYDRNGDRPIMRTGSIVSDPRYDYRRTDGPPSSKDGNHQVLFDAFSTSGNSGSPVFVAQRGLNVTGGLEYSGTFRKHRFIGINAGHLEEPDVSASRMRHVGLSRMYKATAIAAFLETL